MTTPWSTLAHRRKRGPLNTKKKIRARKMRRMAPAQTASLDRYPYMGGGRGGNPKRSRKSKRPKADTTKIVPMIASAQSEVVLQYCVAPRQLAALKTPKNIEKIPMMPQK
jgi:hypothetical protein